VTQGDAAVSAMVTDDLQKRDIVVRAMNQMPGVTCAAPEGTIYAFPCVKDTGVGSQELADRILEQCGVVVEAGSFYGEAGEGYLRVCFGSQPAERIEEAMDRLRGFFSGLAAG
jgi:aspartate aminotransferase